MRFVPYDITTRFRADFHGDLVERFRHFTLLRDKLDNETDPARLPVDDHATTARLASFVASRYFDGEAPGVDIFDLIGRLDKTGTAELRAFLFPGG